MRRCSRFVRCLDDMQGERRVRWIDGWRTSCDQGIAQKVVEAFVATGECLYGSIDMHAANISREPAPLLVRLLAPIWIPRSHASLERIFLRVQSPFLIRPA